MRIKIIGAGSVGTHLAHAARTCGYDVLVVDIDPDALIRQRDQTYPSRYGQWNPDIQQALANHTEPRGNFDLVCIGTPPHTHVSLVHRVLTERPRGLLVEKPLCPVTLHGLAEADEAVRSSLTRVFVGYTHSVSVAMQHLAHLLPTLSFGKAVQLDVFWQEHWEDIFAAHPWLTGPRDSYLGHWQLGGGALGEHSHGAHLWLTLATLLGHALPTQVTSVLTHHTTSEVDYESTVFAYLTSPTGLEGTLRQDVVTTPPHKYAVIRFERGMVEYLLHDGPDREALVVTDAHQQQTRYTFHNPRWNQFATELLHIAGHLQSSWPLSPTPLDWTSGVETMLLLRAIRQADTHPLGVTIDWSRAATPDSVRPVLRPRVAWYRRWWRQWYNPLRRVR